MEDNATNNDSNTLTRRKNKNKYMIYDVTKMIEISQLGRCNFNYDVTKIDWHFLQKYLTIINETV